ncbi:hypothetical protein, partial [Microcystis aeruginosa]|uniref:hypothetical protein n=1 Tax=Microcystis aeruginosa TaxID=1126 RepID=UPI001CA5E21D
RLFPVSRRGRRSQASRRVRLFPVSRRGRRSQASRRVRLFRAFRHFRAFRRGPADRDRLLVLEIHN